jgi:hypothetical protein
MVAFHWDAQGRVDGTIERDGIAAIALGGTALGLLGGLAALLAPKVPDKDRRSYVLWSGCVAGTAGGAWLVPAGLTFAAGSAEDAALDGWLVALVALIFYGIAPFLVLPADSHATLRAAEPLEVGPSEVAVWTRRVSTRSLHAITAGLLVVGFVLLIAGVATDDTMASFAIAGGSVILAAIAVASFASLTVSIDWRGLRVVSTLLRVPFTRIPLDRIHSAGVTDIHASDWGGYGYRTRPRGRAIVLRNGPALLVAGDAADFAITLDDPAVPAGVMQALVAESRR